MAKGFGTEIQEIVKFREFFEEIADHGMMLSRLVNEWYVEKIDFKIKICT